jgi:phosphopantetheine--protein transferase-like protein
MEEKIKEIVSIFTKIPVEQIASSTAIDRSAVNSSIMLHRMYAKLSEQGFIVQDYWDVKNFGSLLQRINGRSNVHDETIGGTQINTISYSESSNKSPLSIGIDIEEIDAMPHTNDFREEAFYKMNFSASEIAYCILQPEPYASFAGLFAAKEAIVKADNTYKSKAFSTIMIAHTETGKPFHKDFTLSISHTKNNAVAVAIQSNALLQQPTLLNQLQTDRSKNFPSVFWLVLVSLLLSFAAIYIASKK